MTQPHVSNFSQSSPVPVPDRSKDHSPRSGAAGSDSRALKRVGVSLGARLYIGFIWLVIAAFPTGLLVFEVAQALQPAPGGVYSNGGGTVSVAWSVVGIEALPVLALYYLAWRQLTRSCRHEAEGLRVRGFWRTHHVPWSAVRDVRATPLITAFRYVAFSNVKIVFMRPDGRAKGIQVSASWNKYLRDALLIRLWSPPGNSLRAGLPGDLRDAESLPNPAEHPGGQFENEPTLFIIRPATSLRLAQAGFLGFLLACSAGFVAWGAVAVGQSSSRIGGAILIVIFGLASILLVAGTARAFCQRLAVYPDMIVCHGLLMKSHFFRADVLEFRQHLSGASGTVIEALLRNGVTHQLSPTAAWGMRGGDKALEQLREWILPSAAGSA